MENSKGTLMTCTGFTSPEKVLTEELNQLINDQLVKRTGYPVVPPKVVYSPNSGWPEDEENPYRNGGI
jgi:Predicted transcriptional regulators